MAPPDAPDHVVTLARLGRMLERRADPDMPVYLYRVLALIAGGDARAARIARKLAVGKPSITAAVEVLVSRGLVAQGELAEDRRGVHLTVTDAGGRVLAHASAHLNGLLDDVLDRCADPQLVRHALEQLAEALDGRAAENDADRAR